MSEKPTRRVVLAHDVTRDDVVTAAWDLGFVINRRIERDGDQPREDIWKDGQTTLHRVEDHMTGLVYLVVRGEQVEATVRRLRKLLPTVTHSDALRTFKSASEFGDRLLALYQMGAAAPEDKANSRVMSALREALGDENPVLRQAALGSIAYAGWPEMEDDVRRASETDQSERVRDTARRLLEAYSKYGSGASP